MGRGLLLQGLGPLAATRVAVAVNSGVRSESEAGDETPRFFPRDDWRSADPAERAHLVAAGPVPLPDAVSVLAADPALRDRFWEQVAPCVCDPDLAAPGQRQESLWDFGRLVADALAAGAGLRPVALRSWDVQVTPAHRPSTAFDYRNRRYVGLHVDNHDRLPFARRREAFQLVCLNLGQAERYLHFVNLAVPDLIAAVGCGAAEAEARFPSVRHLTAAFFRRYPDYPVVRVTLPPDHAYVAVTQFVIHDGATNTLGQPDVAFLLGGRFERTSEP
jgi:hypothetical protein